MQSKPESDLANLIVIHEAIKLGVAESTQEIPLESSRRNEKRSPAERKPKPDEIDGRFGYSGSRSKSFWPHSIPVKHEVEILAVAWKHRQSRFTCAQTKQRECAEESAACANRLQRITHLSRFDSSQAWRNQHTFWPFPYRKRFSSFTNCEPPMAKQPLLFVH